jgi:hypothetical protein
MNKKPKKKLTKAQAGALGGKVSSPAKRRAAKANARKGGRPKKNPESSIRNYSTEPMGESS